jgi:hypothetical protein
VTDIIGIVLVAGVVAVARLQSKKNTPAEAA